MNTRVLFASFLVITVLAEACYAGCFDGCSVATSFGNRTMNGFWIGTLENNKPKGKEFIRTKVYFNYEYPELSVFDASGSIGTFGFFKNSTTFAIFRNHFDYVSANNPCDVIEDVKEFDGRYFVEVSIMMERTGKFTVLIDGSNAYVLTCNTGHILADTNRIDLFISYGIKGISHKFLYDCPFLS